MPAYIFDLIGGMTEEFFLEPVCTINESICMNLLVQKTGIILNKIEINLYICVVLKASNNKYLLETEIRCLIM